MRGTILRIADLRFQPAYIRVAVHRPTLSRRMVERSSVLRRTHRGDVAAVSPVSRPLRFPLTPGAPPPAKSNTSDEPLVRRAQNQGQSST